MPELVAHKGRRRRHTVWVVVALACIAITVVAVSSTQDDRPGSNASSQSGVRPQDTPGGPAVHLVALGDSVPSGYGCQCQGFVESLGAKIHVASGRTVLVHNDAVPGWTSDDVVAALAEEPVSGDLARSDYVVVQIGANEVTGYLDDSNCLGAKAATCRMPALDSLRSNLQTVVTAARRGGRRPTIAFLGYWNVSVDGAVAAQEGPDYVTASDLLTRRTNAVIAQVANQSGAVYVDTYAALKGPDGDLDPTNLLQADGDHPDADGHEALAAATFNALKAAHKLP